MFIEKTECEHEDAGLTWKKILSWVSSHDLYWESKFNKPEIMWSRNLGDDGSSREGERNSYRHDHEVDTLPCNLDTKQF